MRSFRKNLAIILAVAIVIVQCNVVGFADEQLEKPTGITAESITTATNSDAEYDNATSLEEDGETASSSEQSGKASSSDAEYVTASSSDADYENSFEIPDLGDGLSGKDFVPEELLVSVRGGLDGLYFTVDEDQDTTFLDELTFESLAVIEDKYDKGNDEVEVVGEPEEDAPDEDIFDEYNDDEESAGISEYQVFKVTAPGYKTKAQLNKLAKKIEKLPAVQYAELNQVLSLNSTNSTTPDYTSIQWAYKYKQGKYSTGVEDPDYSSDKIINWNEYKDLTLATPSAYPLIPTTSNDPVVVIMDSGIDYDHEDLNGVMWSAGEDYGVGGGAHGYNACAADGVKKSSTEYYTDTTDPMDDYGHGSHCAGIVAAEWNGIGVSGITSGVKLMAIKITNYNGTIKLSTAIKAYKYLDTAQDKDVNIVAINCSWGGSFTGDMINQFVTRAGEKGAVSCFASGNETQDMDKKLIGSGSLSNNPYAVVVNACDENGKLGYFSNYGLKSTDVAAPGVDIYSTTSNKNKDPDYTSSVTVPVYDKSNPSEPMKDNFEGNSGYFDYYYYSSDITLITGAGLDNSKCLKVTGTSDEYRMGMGIDYSKKSFNNSDLPTSMGFAFKCPKVNNCKYVCINAYLKGASNCYASNAYYTGDEWATFTLDVKDSLINAGEVIFRIYCLDSDKNVIRTGFNCYVDNVMFTKGEYGVMSGTSMAAPVAAGEAAILSEYFYKNSTSDKAGRAKNIAARIRGSVQENSNLKNKMQSGGMVRVDYAVRGKTKPVINDLTINKVNGKYVATLNGYFFDGNAGKGENDEKFVSLNIDGKTLRSSDIISKTGGTITFYIPEACVTDEHYFEVISTKGTGSAYIDCHVTDLAAKDRFIQIPISETNATMVAGIPLSLKSYKTNTNKTRMYLLVGNPRTNEMTLWWQDIDQTLFGSNTDGKWTQVENFAGTDKSAFEYDGDTTSMTVVKNNSTGVDKLIGVGELSGKWYIWEYDLTNNAMLPLGNSYDKNLYVDQGLYYFSETGKLFLTYGGYLTSKDPEEYKTYYYELNPNNYGIISPERSISGTEVKRIAEIIYSNSKYYLICGKMYGAKNSYSVEEILFDNTGEMTGLKKIDPNVLSGVSNLFNADDAIVKSAACVNGKIIFTGPAIAYDNYIEADTYVISDISDSSASAVPVNKFVSTTALENVCCTVDDYGNYYVMANTQNSAHNWIYAYTDTSQLEKYVHKDRIIWSYGDEGWSSGGNGGNLVTPYYPSYVEKAGKWTKSVDANGKITWRFTDSKGQPCVNRWVAVPDEEGRTGGPFGWYRFDANGNMITGWYTDDKGRKFYLDPAVGELQGKMKTGWIFIDGKWYYFKETGKDDFGVLVPDKVR